VNTPPAKRVASGNPHDGGNKAQGWPRFLRPTLGTDAIVSPTLLRNSIEHVKHYLFLKQYKAIRGNAAVPANDAWFSRIVKYSRNAAASQSPG
jgi:hypothetical protein